MTTLSQLLKKLSSHYKDKFELRYMHPSLYVICVDDAFGNLDSIQRQLQLVSAIQLTQRDLDDIISHGVMQLILATPQERERDFEFLGTTDTGKHWLSWFSQLTIPDRHINRANLKSEPGMPKALHFYGFKGGQARSTVLTLLAKALADEGARVLVVDADVEAPSLDALFDVKARDVSETLMGLCGWAEHISPIQRVYVGHKRMGTIDLLACRPSSTDYDMDFAGMLLGVTLDARVLQRAAESLRAYAGETDDKGHRYDVVLFDHRTGLAPSVLPIMEGWPGPAVIFVRPDGMSRHLENHGVLRALLAFDINSPGAFVTFSLDPKETVETALDKHGQFVEGLLEVLSDALTESDTLQSHDIDPSELDRYWILWHHDSSVLKESAPMPSRLSASNQSSLNQIREVLGLSQLETKPSEVKQVVLTKSGATDQGTFILTPDIARLFSLESKIRYIFGRKGTGKTRLLKELQLTKLGDPLLVAQDFIGGGVQSGGTAFSALLESCGGDFELFWWALLYSALNDKPEAPSLLSENVNAICSLSRAELKSTATPSTIEKMLLSQGRLRSRVFLIDGVETAVPAAKLREFVESLFRFLAAVQFNQIISKDVTIRLFLRSDLQKSASQNIEQQIEGSVLNLRWTRSSILNFAVARIASLPWFREYFAAVCVKIDSQISIIARGGLSEIEAEGLLLEIFPSDLERNKLKTTTFFAAYFSDAGGENEAKASFYPRLFDGFLREMNNSAIESSKEVPITNGRISSPFVLKAYDAASGAFIDEVRTELYSLLDFGLLGTQNIDAIDKLLGAFSGTRTPFVMEQMVTDLAVRSELQNDRIRDALGKMKSLGIFEDRPGKPGEWRTGRLYKSGLKMKYVRG
jgi:hypothetical protein